MENILIKEVVAPIVILVVGFIVYTIIKIMLKKFFDTKAKKFKNNRYKTIAALIRNIIKYFIIIICVVMILDIYGIDTNSIIASLGIVGVVSGLAMQDFLKDFVAGLSIIFENQYAIGDLVSIDNFKGTVTSFSLKTTRIKAWTGEEKIIANHLVTNIINLTHNNSLAVVDVGVSYGEDLGRVEKVLTKLCERMTKELNNLKGDVVVLGVEELGSSAVVFRVSAEVKAGEQYTTQREMRRKIKDEFDKEQIEIPFNQVVVHNG